MELENHIGYKNETLAAFTVAELGEKDSNGSRHRADARGKMLIYLIEHELFSPTETRSRAQ